ncbi:uncharacterized protein [Linepithema humile]|uniref:uncharacterized protein isoform X3 n=1 Tax=Linepithema humile TaxID=83485 RepID=UPI00351DFB45
MSAQETVQERKVLNRVSKRQRAVQKLKARQVQTFVKSPPKVPVGVPEKCLDLRSILGPKELGFNRWNKFSISAGSVCARSSISFNDKEIFSMHKASGRTREQSKRYFPKRSIVTECKRPVSKSLPIATPPCHSTLSCSPTEKYISPFCHHKSSLKYQDMSRFPHPSPFFIAGKSPSSIICRKEIFPSSSLIKNLKYSLKLSAPIFSNFLKYLLKQKCLSLYKLYFSLRPPFYCAACPFDPHSLLQCSQDVYKSLPRLRKNKMRKRSIYSGPCYPVLLHRVHRRGFHSSFPLAKSKSDKPAACQEMNKICKTSEEKKIDRCDQPYKEKSDMCQEKKVKCDKRLQLNKKDDANAGKKCKTKKKTVDSVCKKTCFKRGKCELPKTDPPPKMTYAKVTCPSPKFVKPNQCPSKLDLQKNGPHKGAEQSCIQKAQICAPLPLPKPPCDPIVLCPCLPPRKLHPGPSPCYEIKRVAVKSSKMPSCSLKKKYPCPTAIHFCPLEKKPCKLKRDKTDSQCERRQKKETPAS